jgi:hypothetical protein
VIEFAPLLVPVLVFDARSSQQIDFWTCAIRRTAAAVGTHAGPVPYASRPPANRPAPGARAWASWRGRSRCCRATGNGWPAQPGGASVALRRLVEQARRDSQPQEERRQAQERCYRFMVAIAGDLPGFEEAARALFAGRLDDLAQQVAGWPADVAAHLLALAQPLQAAATDRETSDA